MIGSSAKYEIPSETYNRGRCFSTSFDCLLQSAEYIIQFVLCILSIPFRL